MIVPGHHALEPSRLLRLLRHHRQRARRARRVPVGGAQRAGDAVAHVAGRHRARRGRARLAAAADRPARRVRGRHLRHGVDLDAARARRRARGWRSPTSATRGLAGRRDLPRLRVYCSEHAHSSVDKAVILLGLGHESLRRIPADAEFRMRADALARRDRRGSRARASLPLAVVATVGTTSTTSVDPVAAIAAICAARADLAARRRGLRRRRGDGARASRAILRRRGARRLARRQPAQVAVHAVRSQRASTAGAWTSCARRSRSSPEYLKTAGGGAGART